MKILLIDDDSGYCEMFKDHTETLKYKDEEKKGKKVCTPTTVSEKKDLDKIEIESFPLIVVDHTLDWGYGVEEIKRLSKKCESDFALISTVTNELYTHANKQNERITGIFGKNDLSKLDEWIIYTIDKIECLEELR